MRPAAFLAVLATSAFLLGCVSGQSTVSSFSGKTERETAAARLPQARPATAKIAANPAANPYDGLIARYAAENGVPLSLAHAVIEKESGYNAKATGRGTIGLMQIKPATARGIGFKGSTEELYDPETNLSWGMKYLGGAYELGGGDVCGTALRYQGGHRATTMTASARRYCADLKQRMAANGD